MRFTPLPQQEMDTKRIYIARDPGIKDYHAEIDGFEREWKEYVPSYYSTDKKWAVLFSLHGGDINSAYKFTWPMMAEHYGFIVIYPQSISEEIMWNVYGAHTREEGFPDDMVYLNTLFEIISEKYSVDKTRFYIHGQSFGDITAMWYLMEHSEIFAAAAPSSGPSPASNYFDEAGMPKVIPSAALPIVRSHGSYDLLMPGVEVPEWFSGDDACRLKFFASQLANLEVWKQRNGIRGDMVPQLAIRGNWNVMYWQQEDGLDVGYVATQEYEHNPHPDFADLLWKYFLSAYSRVDGKIIKENPICKLGFCRDNVALADGSITAYVGGKLIRMEGAAHFKSSSLFPKGYMYTTVHLFTQAYGASIDLEDDGMSARISLNGKCVQVAAGIRGAIVDGTSVHMLPISLDIDGKLYVAFGEVAELLLGTYTYDRAGATYISRERGVMTMDMALMIRCILGVEKDTTPASWVALERKYSNGEAWY